MDCAGGHSWCRAACDRAGVHSFSRGINRTVQDTLTWNEPSAEADRDGEDGSYTEDDTAVEDTGEEREVLELPDSLGKDFFVTQDDIYVADQLSYTVTAQHIEVPNSGKTDLRSTMFRIRLLPMRMEEMRPG